MKHSAIILAGGLGERMRPLTDTLPKPMLPVGGEPNMCRLLDTLLFNGFESAVVCLGYLPGKIKALGKSCRGVDLTYLTEDTPLGTAGAAAAAKDLCGEDFLVISGDAVCTLDLSAAMQEHIARGAAATVILHTVPEPGEYGCVVCDNGRIVSFCEKPAWQSVVSDKVNTGIYILSRRVFDYVGPPPCDFARDVFPAMLEAGETLIGYEPEGSWRDIGSFSEYLLANRELSRYAEGELEGSVCGDGFIMGENSAFINSVAFDGVRIADNCSIVGCILGRNVTVGDGCVLRDGCVIGEGAVINDGVRLGAGTVIGTGKTVKNDMNGDGKNKAEFENGEAEIGAEQTQTVLLTLAAQAANGSGGIVGVCCDGGGLRKNEAELFARACRDRGGVVYEFGPASEPASALAGPYFGCAMTFRFVPRADGTAVICRDENGDVPSPDRMKKLGYAKETPGRKSGKLTQVGGLDLLYCAALSSYARLDGVKLALVCREGGAEISDALRRAGAELTAAADVHGGGFIINLEPGSSLLYSGGVSLDFDECLLAVLGMTDPSVQPAVALPYFLPRVFAKTAEASGIKVLFYRSRPATGQSADDRARRLRRDCRFVTDPLFCAVKLAELLKKERMSLSEAKKKYVGQTLVREQIRVPKARKAALLRRMYESYMPYQTDACDGVRIVEAGAEGVIMADDSDRMRLVISADSAEAAEDAVAEVMMRLGLT